MDWREDVWSRFRKDLPGLVLLWAGVTAIAVVLQMLDGRGTTDPIDIIIYMAVIGVALTPLVWIRYEIPLIRGREHALRRTFAVIGFGCLWAVVALVGGIFVLALIGID